MDNLSRRVLLVEDNEDDYIIVRDLFSDIATTDFDLEWASTYSEAREALTRSQYDVCLLDYRLGEATGVDIVREFGAGATPFILLTGNEDYEVDVTAAKAGVADYLLKGHINGPILERSIRYAIERKNTEVALLQAQRQAQASADSVKSSEERYRRLFESAKDGILILDAKTGQIEDVNPYLWRLLGYGPEDFVGKQLWEIGSFRDVAANQEAFGILQENEYIRYDDLPLATSSGQSVSVEFISNVYTSGDRKVIQCNIRDISERKEAEAAERESQRLLQSTLDALGSHIAVLGENGEIIAVNKMWQQFSAENHGDPATCGVGANYLAICDAALNDNAEEAPAMAQGIRAVISGQQKTVCLEYPCHSPQEERWFNVCVTRFGGDGPGRVVIAHENVSERKQTQAELQEREEFQQTLLQNFPNGSVNVFDRDLRYVLAAGHGLEQSGMSARQLVGKTLDEVFSPDQVALAKPHYQQALRGETVEFELPLLNRYYNICAAPLYSRGGEVFNIIAVAQDITERKGAEQGLRESEQRFQSIVTNTPGTVYQFLYKPDGSIEIPFVNEGCRELFEIEPEELRANPTFPIEIIHPADRQQHQRSVLESMQTLEPWSCEWRIRLPSGKTKWIDGAAHPQRLPDGSTLWDGLLMDITARKEAEEERDRFFTLSLDMLAVVGSDGYFKRLNPAFSATLGFSNAELMAVPFLEWVHPDDHATTLEQDAKLRSGGKVMQFENRYRCRDGSHKWLRWMCAPYEDLFYCVAHDITGVKQSAAALHKANDELELRVEERTAELEISNRELRHTEARLLEGNTIFTGLTRLRVTTDEELHTAITQITEAGSTLLDTDRCSVWLYNEDSKAIGCADMYQRSTQSHTQGTQLSAEDYPDYFQALATRRPIIADEAHTHPATHEFSQSYLTPLGIASMLDIPVVIGGQMVGVLCFEHIGDTRHWQVEDQTLAGSAASICSLALESHERTRAEIALREAKEEAEASRREADKANLAKSEFLSRMSHELRTPLNAILGFGQILERQPLPQASKDSVGYILQGGRHLLGLINEVLEIARVEAGHLELSLEPIALHDVVPDACALMRPLAAEHNIDLEENLAGLGHIHVMADRQRLKQVLINLVANAIKYNRDGGRVEVSCEQNPDGSISLAVCDTGPGMSPEDLTKIFTPFERLGASTSTIEGTGLGLTLSQLMVTAMGGTLSVQSTLGEGSTFTIELAQATLPEVMITNSQESPYSVDANRQTGRTYSVLCIEDNPSNLQLMEAIFENRPEIILLAAIQGGMGLDMARQHEPDLILLDLNLPDIHGKDVLVRLQQSPQTAHIPVVIVSADATPNQIERLLAAGARYYLTKPIDIDQVLRTVDELLPQETVAD